ncbi:cytochrome P450 [Umezawaea sp. Da 62-37]|uniref:cytochrome P450 family protein n=1 Tax=Umezawaea sp. Da 62-37 TaxID=3075927 RepID=UPI0028F7462B|nr:cytochrome P450 [Umezawaea sp. Da 62-37]WNV83183.1 cytochrome P450 [Umezawaea sp. Da 62-37]
MFSEHYWDQHAEVEDTLRAQGPAHRVALPNGVPAWVITGYEAARTVLTHPAVSKDSARLERVMTAAMRRAGHHEAELSGMFRGMLFADPPHHKRLREPVAKAFTPRRIAALRPRVEQITNDLLDALPTNAPVDLVSEFAFELPVTVICELMGVPVSDREPFRAWTADLMEDHPDVVGPANDAMAAYFAELIATKRRTPGHDLLSALATSSEATDGLTDDELIGTCFLLFVAGHETTTNLIGNAVHATLRHPTAWSELAADTSLAAGAVRETLRHDSPVRMATHRITIEPMTIQGTTIPADEVVLVSLGAANRDPAYYPCPTEFDLHRDDTAPQLSFGHGLHYCLGAALGRMEAEIALSRLPSRFPRSLPTDEHPLRRSRSVIMNGPEQLGVILRR